MQIISQVANQEMIHMKVNLKAHLTRLPATKEEDKVMVDNIGDQFEASVYVW